MNSLFMIFQFYIAFDLKREQMIILYIQNITLH